MTWPAIKKETGLKSATLVLPDGKEISGDELRLSDGCRRFSGFIRRPSSQRMGLPSDQLMGEIGNDNPSVPKYWVSERGDHHRFFAVEDDLNEFLEARRSENAEVKISFDGEPDADVDVYESP